MKDEDLEQFAVADGLLARISAEPDHMSDAERDYLLLMGAKMLSRVADLSGEEAYRLIWPSPRRTRPPSSAAASSRASPASAGCCTSSAATTCAAPFTLSATSTTPRGILHFVYYLNRKCSRWRRVHRVRRHGQVLHQDRQRRPLRAQR
jgi:hypothetical protein